MKSGAYYTLIFDSVYAIIVLDILLSLNGTFLPDSITKHLTENIWELRPGANRIFYFYCDNDTYVLLHHFRKKSNKTPRREIDKAKAERDDYLFRKENGLL